MEPISLVNSLVNQLTGQPPRFSGITSSTTSTPSNTTAGTTSNSDIRDRVNTIRRLLSYIATNFRILENPNHLMSSPLPQAQISTEPRVLGLEYAQLFHDTFSAFDRLRPHLNRFTDLFEGRTNMFSANNEMGMPGSFSILMRITHHLSHVFHLLTDFRVDFNSAERNYPLSVNVMPLVPSNDPSGTAPSSTGSASAAPGDANSSPQVSQVQPQAQFNNGAMAPGMFVAQSPIVFMEIESSVDNSPNSIDAFRNYTIHVNGQQLETDSNVPLQQAVNDVIMQNTAAAVVSNLQNPFQSSHGGTNNNGSTPATSTENTNSTASQGNSPSVSLRQAPNLNIYPNGFDNYLPW